MELTIIQKFKQLSKKFPNKTNLELLKQITDKVFVKHHLHPDLPLVLLKYDQLKSPFTSPIVQECRGLILDYENQLTIIAYPYKKFFNINEDGAADIGWSTAAVYEKFDGSLCCLYYYQNSWHVSSSGTVDGSGIISSEVGPFQKLFWEIWENLNYTLPLKINFCYMFEMITNKNIIIVRPDKDDMILHGVRNLETLQEEKPKKFAIENNWNFSKKIFKKKPENITEDNFGSFLLDYSKKLNPVKQEGFVVVDKDFNRLKIKSPQYVSLSYLRPTQLQKKKSSRNMLEIIRQNEQNEFLSYYPEYKELYLKIKNKYDFLIKTLNSGLNGKKINQPYLKHVSNIQDADVSIEDYLRNIDIWKVLGLLDLQKIDSTKNNKNKSETECENEKLDILEDFDLESLQLQDKKEQENEKNNKQKKGKKKKRKK